MSGLSGVKKTSSRGGVFFHRIIAASISDLGGDAMLSGSAE